MNGRRRSHLALGFVMALACGACGTGNGTGPTRLETGEMTIRVQGTITSADDGRPVPGAWVRLVEWASLQGGYLDACAWARADDNGFFSLACSGRSCLMAPGGHLSGPLIVAGAAGFHLLIPVRTDCTNEPQVFSLVLARS